MSIWDLHLPARIREVLDGPTHDTQLLDQVIPVMNGPLPGRQTRLERRP